MSNELVRHFLIECTQKGVRLKGCPNEPYFGEDTHSLVLDRFILKVNLHFIHDTLNELMQVNETPVKLKQAWSAALTTVITIKQYKINNFIMFYEYFYGAK